jgi:fructose-1,6-bisphosphatase/inositol monophosphatase family enzyme
MSISLINLLIDATRIPARKLMRDYYELESLQNNGKQNDVFVLQSVKRIKENIATELLKHRVTSSFFFKEEQKPNKDFYIYVIPIDSIYSLKRATPFFGIMATLFRENEAEMSVIHFPTNKEIIYTEKGRGVWVEKINRNNTDPVRVCASNISDITKASIMSDNIASIFEYKDYCNPFTNVEVISSQLYNLYSICHGFIDASIISIDCDFFVKSVSLFCLEAKLTIRRLDGSKKYIITNSKFNI